jgi:response regulator RpfG family c-di-GMP phosphodiesterase
MNENILIVDDDPEILNSFRRSFIKKFLVDTANGAEEGLMLLKQKPFLVVVSDFKMPRIDGIQFLTMAKEVSPDTTRIMLTGYAEVNTAIEAVNEGNIYRFLTKPCPPETLAKSIQAGIEYYQLRTAERVLLEQTLNGSISMLVEILGLINPTAFSRSNRIKKLVSEVVKELNISPSWYYELAAALSQIGFVSLPQQLLEKIYLRKELSNEETLMLNNHPHIGRRLIEKIPRLETIALMIDNQNKQFFDYPSPSDEILPKDPVVLGAQILKVVIDYDNLVSAGYSDRDILLTLKARKGYYNNRILTIVLESTKEVISWQRKKINLIGLCPGMVVDEDIFTVDSLLLLRRGQEVTDTVLDRLRNINTHSRLIEPFYVLAPIKGQPKLSSLPRP